MRWVGGALLAWCCVACTCAPPPPVTMMDAGHDAGQCGDAVLEQTERCDDGNTASGDGCAGNCSGVEVGFVCPDAGGACTDTVVCGDAKVERDETCDDGNTTSNDGCTRCALESGWRCPVPGKPCLAARCGDGQKRGTEDCDDGNTAPGDGCDEACRTEPGWDCPKEGEACTLAHCGDHVRQGAESCDDGNSDFDDGCTPVCTAEPTCTAGLCVSRCGDRLFQPDAGEQCDDGDLRAQDGCSATCAVEPGYTCTLAEPDTLTLPIVLRDFHDTHPDFEQFIGADPDIVLDTLGPDGKPVYAYSDGGRSPTTTGRDDFDQWYSDVPDANFTVRQQLALRAVDAGVLEFGSLNFFPLDGLGFGNEGRSNNFHFTTETRLWFTLRGAPRIEFIGDDDMFIFVNGHRVVNLGGVHFAASGSVVLDAPTAASLGLVEGGLYEVALFHAERHTVASTFRLILTGFDFRLSRCARACGDGQLDAREECDDGVLDGGYGRCGPSCTWDQWCGDAKMQGPAETCDDGRNAVLYGDAGCTPGCQLPHRCGDGLIDSRFGEECDDGNTVSGDGCAACRIER